MQRNPMARSARGKNPPKEKTKKKVTEATSSTPAAEKTPTPPPEENPTPPEVPPQPIPTEVQPQPDIGQDNPAEAKSDEAEPDPEEIIQEFMRKYGKGPKASKFFAQMSEACRKQEEVIPALTPLTIPPRPKTLIETPTAQALPTHPPKFYPKP
ncbi:cell surface glycoprotein 1-like [Salvia hispanica]|uniref:cell surface glycoprotein 1-like n=1 Tax=Salvia hispanica TaxID=49212 RepID=UPI002009096F|nr:cell surface glycoprotein 1-like [Salvia hispanica]